MELKNFISIASILGYAASLLVCRNIRRHYLLFVLYCFPFIDLFITPVTMGGFKVLDVVSYISLFLLILLDNSKVFNKPTINYLIFFILLNGALLLGSLNSLFKITSIISLAQLNSILIFAKLVTDECTDNPAFIDTILKVLRFQCLASLVFLALQLVFGLKVTIYQLSPNVSQFDSAVRYPSFFQDPQKYGHFLAVLSFLFLIDQKKTKQNGLNLIFFLLTVVAIFLTGVRAALSGLCIGAFIVFLFGDKRIKLGGIICLVAGLMIMLVYADHFAIFNRGANVNDTAQTRYEYWAGGLKVFLDHPLLGIGIGTYQPYVSLFEQNQYWNYFGTFEYVDHPESGYLKLLAEFGIIAFVLYMSLLLIPLGRSIHRIVTTPVDRPVLLFVTAAILSWMVAFLTVYSFSDIRICALIIVLLSVLITYPKVAAPQ